MVLVFVLMGIGLKFKMFRFYGVLQGCWPFFEPDIRESLGSIRMLELEFLGSSLK